MDALLRILAWKTHRHYPHTGIYCADKIMFLAVCELMLIRMYALKCLLCTSAGTVQPNTFWDQIQKSCTVYVRYSSPMSEAEELSVAKLVSKSLGEVVQIAQSKSSFVEGKPFVLLCETWASFAKRVRDSY
jgi:separase